MTKEALLEELKAVILEITVLDYTDKEKCAAWIKKSAVVKSKLESLQGVDREWFEKEFKIWSDKVMKPKVEAHLKKAQ